MREFSSELAVQSRESANVASPILVHAQPGDTLAEHAQNLVSIPETEITGNESIGDKLLREAQVVTWGVGGAFGDVAEDPLSKLPEAATAGAFGVGLRVLERAGTKGKVLAGVVGGGMFAKMGYDEWRGERWSEFGGAMGAAWESKANFYSSVEATKRSVGALAVDMAVGTAAFKVAGVYNPAGSRSTLLSESGLSFASPSRSFSNATEFSLMGQRCSHALGEPMTALRMIAKPASTRELTIMGQRSTTALSEVSNRQSSLGTTTISEVSNIQSSLRTTALSEASSRQSSMGTNALDSLSARTRDPLKPNAHDLVSVRKQDAPAEPQIAKSPEPALKVEPSHKWPLTEALQAKLFIARGPEEIGFLSAIREVTTFEAAPGFVPSRRAYQEIVEHLDRYALVSDSLFSKDFRTVSELVKLHAQTFSD